MNCKLQVQSIGDITMIIMCHELSPFSRFGTLNQIFSTVRKWSVKSIWEYTWTHL